MDALSVLRANGPIRFTSDNQVSGPDASTYDGFLGLSHIRRQQQSFSEDRNRNLIGKDSMEELRFVDVLLVKLNLKLGSKNCSNKSLPG